MKVTYLGHSCFIIESEKSRILLDPFISQNEKAKDIDINEIKTDYIFITHGHFDHMLDAEVIAKNCNAKIVSNYEIISWYQEKKGIENGHPMNHGGKWNFDFGTVWVVNAIHSSMLPDRSYGGNPMGFVFEIDGKKIYFAGDTALTYDMKLIGDKHELDAAFLPIGDNFTMGYEDACTASDFVKCDNVVGMHFDTMDIIKVEHEEVKKYYEERGKKIHLLDIKESLDI